jgi:hypothetical protein
MAPSGATERVVSQTEGVVSQTERANSVAATAPSHPANVRSQG